MWNSLALPQLSEVIKHEGKGNYAVKKYYQFPYSLFYRHKFRMIVNLIDKRQYRNILDFGCGPHIFEPELRRHCTFYKGVDKDDIMDTRWRYEAVVCSSSLEFVSLPTTLKMLKKIITKHGHLYVASPMSSKLSRQYFKFIGDTHKRHSDKTILKFIRKHFIIDAYKEWMGLYFALRARPK